MTSVEGTTIRFDPRRGRGSQFLEGEGGEHLILSERQRQGKGTKCVKTWKEKTRQIVDVRGKES